MPPREPGVVQTSAAIAGAAPVASARISAAASLSALLPEYVLFSPALLYTLLPLNDRDPIAEYVAAAGVPLDKLPTWLNLPVPVLSGMSPEAAVWNFRVGLWHRDIWHSFRDFFARAAFTDAAADLFAMLRWQEVSIVDAVVIARATHLPKHGWPKVPLHVMAIESNKYRAYVRGTEFIGEYVCDKSLLLLHQAWKNEASDPYGVVEKKIETETGVSPDQQRLDRAVADDYVVEQTARARERLDAVMKEQINGGQPRASQAE